MLMFGKSFLDNCGDWYQFVRNKMSLLTMVSRLVYRIVRR